MGFNRWLPQSPDFSRPEVALHACICDGDHARLRALLATASPRAVNRLDDKWGSPLHLAIRHDDLAAADLLLRAGADPVAQRDFRGMGYDPPAPLLLAVGLGRAALARRLWRHAPPGHARQRRHPALLVAAARRLDFFCVEMLLTRAEFALDALNEALHAATVDTEYETAEGRARELCTVPEGLSQERIVRALIEKGADPNMRCRDGEPLVTEAARFTERAVALRALLEGGADANVARKNGSTALHLLAAPVSGKKACPDLSKHHEVGVGLLLKHGASMYTKAAREELPLHRAAFGGNMTIFRLYLSALKQEDQESNVLPQLTNGHGESLLHWAAAGGRRDILEYLLSHEGSTAHVNGKTDNGWTPLLCALVPQTPASKVAHEAIQAARLLLARGADPRVASAEGWTPLHCLALHRDEHPAGEAYALARDLIAGGADTEAKAAQPLVLRRRHHAWGHEARVAVARAAAACPPGLQMHTAPLVWAEVCGACGVRRALLENGAELSLADERVGDAVRAAWESWRLEREDV